MRQTARRLGHPKLSVAADGLRRRSAGGQSALEKVHVFQSLPNCFVIHKARSDGVAALEVLKLGLLDRFHGKNAAEQVMGRLVVDRMRRSQITFIRRSQGRVEQAVQTAHGSPKAGSQQNGLSQRFIILGARRFGLVRRKHFQAAAQAIHNLRLPGQAGVSRFARLCSVPSIFLVFVGITQFGITQFGITEFGITQFGITQFGITQFGTTAVIPARPRMPSLQMARNSREISHRLPILLSAGDDWAGGGETAGACALEAIGVDSCADDSTNIAASKVRLRDVLILNEIALIQNGFNRTASTEHPTSTGTSIDRNKALARGALALPR